MPNRVRKEKEEDFQERGDQSQSQKNQHKLTAEEFAEDRNPANSLGASINEGLGTDLLTTPESREQASESEYPEDELFRGLDRTYFGATAVPTEDSDVDDGLDNFNGARFVSYARGKILEAPYAYLLGAFGLGLVAGQLWKRD